MARPPRGEWATRLGRSSPLPPTAKTERQSNVTPIRMICSQTLVASGFLSVRASLAIVGLRPVPSGCRLSPLLAFRSNRGQAVSYFLVNSCREQLSRAGTEIDQHGAGAQVFRYPHSQPKFSLVGRIGHG